MGLFTKTPKVAADGYERKTIRGYAHKGPVAKALADGWEIENVQPVIVHGTTWKQGIYTLKRKSVQ